ncbi:hypothetical protein PVAG01_02057 [Phlyctema vagabunda]|uniref:Uncharacterized protein n=1 Tax=Phlyctema vagabunda TaxID=108571 RepID=A0ABR4PPJ7_9HELO
MVSLRNGKRVALSEIKPQPRKKRAEGFLEPKDASKRESAANAGELIKIKPEPIIENEAETEPEINDSRNSPFEANYAKRKDVHVCFDKRPNGSPTYDESGFEIDYEKVANWSEPKAVRNPTYKKIEAHFDKAGAAQKRAAELFFEPGKAPTKGMHIGVNH